MSDEDIKFLRSLNPDGKATGSWYLPPATRAQDAARVRAKKRGWAEFDRQCWAWKITPLGYRLLSEARA